MRVSLACDFGGVQTNQQASTKYKSDMLTIVQFCFYLIPLTSNNIDNYLNTSLFSSSKGLELTGVLKKITKLMQESLLYIN